MLITIPYGDILLEVKLVYKERKALTIKVDSKDTAVALVPLSVPHSWVIETIHAYGPWIAQRQETLAKGEKTFAPSERFYYLGQSYPLELKQVKEEKDLDVQLTEGKLTIWTLEKDPAVLESLLTQWYKERAYQTLSERVSLYEPYVSVKPQQIKITSPKKRWGSASGRGTLCFNWRIVQAPLEVLDYLVVHELCHLTHLDHSPRFWNLVASILPTYPLLRAWLKGKSASRFL